MYVRGELILSSFKIFSRFLGQFRHEEVHFYASDIPFFILRCGIINVIAVIPFNLGLCDLFFFFNYL